MPRIDDYHTVWSPIPDTSQELAMDSRCHHTLYCGTRGPGKSDCQLMRFRRHVGKGYGSFWRGIIFDKEYKNLDDLVIKSQRWFNAFADGAKWLSSAKDYKWVWPTGEELLFRAVTKQEDYWGYHGHEFPFIGWNELCKYPTANLYSMMMSVNRTSFTPDKDTPAEIRKTGKLLPPIPLEVFATTNPWGVGHGWVKRMFIDVAPYGHVVRRTVEVFDPVTQQKVPVTKTQVAIFGSYKENIYLPLEYIVELENQSDPNLRLAWLYGDWDIVAGGALSDLWRKDVHVLPRFKIPSGWHIDRAFDWGSTQPFYVGWFAEANGETATLSDGTTFTPQPGSLILFDEWYGTTEDKLTGASLNTGLKLSSIDIAKGIHSREDLLCNQHWIGNERPAPGPADNQIREVREKDVDTLEKKMADHGVHWLESDKSPGSRKIGLQLIRERLEASVRREGPGLYFMQNCRHAISIIPTLPRDEDKLDDVDTEAEDHPYDVLRYRVLHGNNRLATKIPLVFPH